MERFLTEFARLLQLHERAARWRSAHAAEIPEN
nr:MAG TPA: hypothetical protein [Caudoviricetes sp.]